jgi:hypothetical protein
MHETTRKIIQEEYRQSILHGKSIDNFVEGALPERMTLEQKISYLKALLVMHTPREALLKRAVELFSKLENLNVTLHVRLWMHLRFFLIFLKLVSYWCS